jgi:hypothetical protein
MPHPLGGKYDFSVTIALSALIKMPYRLFKKHRGKCHRWYRLASADGYLYDITKIPPCNDGREVLFLRREFPA